jgi:FkbM family methyltransferase
VLRDLKYRLIRTPLERPLMSVRHLLRLPQRLRHPELSEIYKEDARIEAVLAKVLRPDSNCLDIGAHYGSVLSTILRRSPRGRHVAVEAIPEKAQFLREKFPEVTLHELALSDESGSVDFFINTQLSGFSGMMQQEGAAADSYEKVVVPCETLDNLMRGVDYRVDFLKIDVEGAEERVLGGGREFLAASSPLILFECGDTGPSAFGRTPADLFQLFGELEYDVFFLKDWLAGGDPTDVAGFEGALVYPFTAFNWVAQARRGPDTRA